ncbi:hypothetical protein OPU71_00600 [Niveibacterium sp. 24ML]|uniref:hypothetical protein n=1 Tax=Niveibacterium sp. 24ML TaxID=2985512 RepID=UPI002270FE88|nr:hypothetical protein [Niveibacterium sp. 24ML]MCX9154617.1 hypothetical protein [Niveibacterium sp. 24ML]
MPTVACVADGERMPGMLNRCTTDRIVEMQHVTQQRQEPLAHSDFVGTNVLPLAQDLKVLPEVECNLEVAGNFVAQLQALGDAVVAFCLLGVLGVGE